MINERILQLIEIKYKGNKRAFAKRIGVSPSSIDNVVGSRKSKPNFDMLEKILSSFDDVDADWLMLGKEPPTRPQEPNKDPAKGNYAATEFYKKLSEERKEELQLKEKEIARLNILIGRYEERLTNFHSRKNNTIPIRGSVPLVDPRDNTGGSTLPELPILSQETSDALSPHSTNPDE